MEHTAKNTHTNGAALAAFLSAGIGSAMVGLMVLMHEIGIWSAPTIWPPGAGGLSGRVGIGLLAWGVAWIVLAKRWKGKDGPLSTVFAWTIALVVFAFLATFPPVWTLLGKG